MVGAGAWRLAPHTWHQVWISASLSVCLADSMRLVFASCQPGLLDCLARTRDLPYSREKSENTFQRVPLGDSSVDRDSRGSSV